jgi:hypothetical protein
LLAEQGVEAEGVAGGGDVGWRRAFAEHLLDRVSRDQVDQEEDEGHDQPDDWESIEDALEERFQLAVLSSRFSVGKCPFTFNVILSEASANALA